MNWLYSFALVFLFLVSGASLVRDCKKPSILGGRVNLRNRGQTARYFCRKPYHLFGTPLSTCVRGVWRPPVPKCGVDCPVTHVRYGKMYEQGTVHNMSDETGSPCSTGFEALPFLTAHCDGFISNVPYPICLAEPCATTYKNCRTEGCYVIPGRTLKELYVSCEPGYIPDGTDKVVCEISAVPHFGCFKDHQVKLSCDFNGLVNPKCSWGVPKSEFNNDGIFMWLQSRWKDADFQALPDNDHTFELRRSYHGGGYLFLPAHLMNMGDRARLHSPTYELANASYCFSFWYHMESRGVGELNIFVNNRLEWTMAGPQGNDWVEATFPLPSGNVTIIVEATRGFSSDGFISVDDFSIVDAAELGHGCYGEETEATTMSEPEDTLLPFSTVNIFNNHDNSESNLNLPAVNEPSTQDVKDSIHSSFSTTSSSLTQSFSTSLNFSIPSSSIFLSSSSSHSSVDSNQNSSSIPPETTEHNLQSTHSSPLSSQIFHQTLASTFQEFHPSTSNIWTVHPVLSHSLSTLSVPQIMGDVSNFHTSAIDRVDVGVNTKPLPDTVEGIQLNAHKTENATDTLASNSLPTETVKEIQLNTHKAINVIKEFSSSSSLSTSTTTAPPTLHPLPDDILESGHSDSENDVHDDRIVEKTGNDIEKSDNDFEKSDNDFEKSDNDIEKSDNHIEKSENDFVGSEIVTHPSFLAESSNKNSVVAKLPPIFSGHADHSSAISAGTTVDSYAGEDVSFSRGTKFLVNSYAPKADVSTHPIKFSDDLDNGIDPSDSVFDEHNCRGSNSDCHDSLNYDEPYSDYTLEKTGTPSKDGNTSDKGDNDVETNRTNANSDKNEVHHPPLNGRLAEQLDDYQDPRPGTSKIDEKLHIVIVTLTAVALLLMIVAVIAVFKVARRRLKKQQCRRGRMSEDDLSLNLQLSNSKEILNFSLLRSDHI